MLILLRFLWKILRLIIIFAVLLIVAYIGFCIYSYVTYNGAALEEIPGWVVLLLGGEDGKIFNLLF